MGRSRVLVLREPVEVRVDGGVEPILCFTNHELVNAIMRCVSEWPYGTVTIQSLAAPPRPEEVDPARDEWADAKHDADEYVRSCVRECMPGTVSETEIRKAVYTVTRVLLELREGRRP